jgi:hypothetical protein
VNGALYVEFDRGGVIYQNQNNVWKYLAGTMWGTLSPDQRPTDLGVNDGGFDFRATDQQREFIWSQTAWVEVTPVTGAVNLTHPNVVTKVGTAGQIVEGGITDQSAANSDRLHIAADGNIGIATLPGFYIFRVRAGANIHLGIQPGVSVASALVLNVFNDAASANIPMELRASRFSFQVGTVDMPNLPAGNPGAGSKQLWYDPADGNRVKFAP